MKTTLRNVKWPEDTFDARLVPIAIFDPVQVGQIIVDRAPIDDLTKLEELDLWLGDTIDVVRGSHDRPRVFRRIGEHAEGSRPIPSWNGFPVGAGDIVNEYLVEPGLLHVDMVVGKKKYRAEVASVGGEITRSFIDEDLSVRTMHELWDEPLHAAVQMWLDDGLENGTKGVAFVRLGRDLVRNFAFTFAVEDIAFASKVLGVRGITTKVAGRILARNPEVRGFASFLAACRNDDLIPFEGVSRKQFDRLVSGAVTKFDGPQDPAKWVEAMGIQAVGYAAAQKLCEHLVRLSRGNTPGAHVDPFTLFDEHVDLDGLTTIPGIGPSKARNLGYSYELFELWSCSVNGITWDWSKYTFADEAEDATAQ